MRRFGPLFTCFFLASLLFSCDTFWDYVLMYRPGHARYIKPETYVMDRDQVAKIYNYPHPAKPYQKPNCELVGKPQYLVIHFNQPGLNGSCILRWRINEGPWTETTIRQMRVRSPYYHRVEYQVIPIGAVVDQNDGGYPEVTYKIKAVISHPLYHTFR